MLFVLWAYAFSRAEQAHGKVDSKVRFPLLHTPDGDEISTKQVIGLVIPEPDEMLVFDRN